MIGSGNERTHSTGIETAKILITTTNTWPSSSRLMVEFSGIGHVVAIVCPINGHPSRKVRYVHRTFPYRPLAPLDSLADAIEATKPDIIIPCDDKAVRHLHRLHSSRRAQRWRETDIPALIERSLGPPESYAIVDSRNLLLKIAEEERILTPRTNAIDSTTDLELLRSMHPLPWVLKADGTTGGTGVRIAHTIEEARGHHSQLRQSMGLLRSVKRLVVDRDLILEGQWRDRFGRSRPAVVVQSFVRGAAANCAVACWKGEVLAGLSCEAVTTEAELGPATVIRIIDNDGMMVAARRLARRLRLSGFFGLDFVIQEGTGVAYLIEINPRCTPPSHIRLGAGRDMVGMLSARLTGKPLSEPVSITPNNLIAYFPQALLRNSELLPSSYHDAPYAEPDLLEELCRPFPSRKIRKTVISSMISQFFSKIDRRGRLVLSRALDRGVSEGDTPESP